MTYDYAVIYNGEYYPAGAEIKVKDPKQPPKSDRK